MPSVIFLFTKPVRNALKSLPILAFLLLGCEEQYSKQDALNQSRHCLEIKNDLGGLSNERNPYFLLIAANIENQLKVNDSIIFAVDRISREIDEKNLLYFEALLAVKSKHKDSRFIDATLEFIRTNQNLESKTYELVKSLLDSERNKEVEKKIIEDLRSAAKKMIEVQSNFLAEESKFHNDNGITQNEVDSIVRIIKNKKSKH
ncbi:MAG: hypothetical protein AAFU57_09350 [Bacteroidota bacterium]